MVTYITAQYRHVVVCSGLYPVRSQSLHGRYSSGCIESAMQPSSTEKSSRTTLHYVMQNDSARDLVLPPCRPASFQLTHMSHEDHARSTIASAMAAQVEDNNLLQHSHNFASMVSFGM